ncbi:phosphoesterase family-domain-containing protein [Boletus reticuloceps]|uniref:Phosphoesterase family-domain-containing protein n=1 Tax=Boletus reticuloceps TaxID=495285 RepID=A0A8I2YPM6_9AGAM|nr:phosphoesterase family-domain-containing protein [Boletus reticuloceps]
MLRVVGALALAAKVVSGSEPSANWREHIKNVVVLVQENRSFDSFFGDLSYRSDINNIRHLRDKYCNPANLTSTESTWICAEPTGSNVSPDDPNHSLTGVNYQLFSTYHPNESGPPEIVEEKERMLGFVIEHEITHRTYNLTRAADVMQYLPEEMMPVYRTMAENYVLFDNWFCDVPGPTNPNRAYMTSGTSHGHGRNDLTFHIFGLPQRSIFQQLDEANITWINYYNSSFNPDADFYAWTQTSGRSKTHVQPIARFFADAKAGTLPQFTWINPECCIYDSMHPPSPVNMGEAWTKRVYEALRSSPQWDNILFLVTFDEHGGYADHVSPPVGIPPGDNLTYTEVAQDGKEYTFSFDRLGVRVPSLVISPWVQKGALERLGPNDAIYSHSSLPAFISKLWNLDDGVPLTPRAASAASFEHLITDDFRADTPAVLPDPWGYTREDSEPEKERYQPGVRPVSELATSRLVDNLDYLGGRVQVKNE